MKNVLLILPRLIKCKTPKTPKREKYEFTDLPIFLCVCRLTDDDTRKNYEEFGHPDGKQSFTMGVALPKGLVEGNGFFVLSFYALAFGLGLPYFIVSNHTLFFFFFFILNFNAYRLNGGISRVVLLRTRF